MVAKNTNTIASEFDRSPIGAAPNDVFARPWEEDER
jgi:hypothetical protein